MLSIILSSVLPGMFSSGLISIRVSDPWIMRRAFWSTCLHHTIRFRVITHSAISRGTGGWRCRVAFPWRKVFDIFQRRGRHDPIKCLRNGYHPHVTHGCKFLKEGHRSYHEFICKMTAISECNFTLKFFPLSQIPSGNDFFQTPREMKIGLKKIIKKYSVRLRG